MWMHANASTFVLFHMDITKVFLEQIAQDLNAQQILGIHIIIHRYRIYENALETFKCRRGEACFCCGPAYKPPKNVCDLFS